MVERQTPNLYVGGSNPSWPVVLNKYVLRNVGSGMAKLMTFLNEVRAEMHKVTWPKQNELVGATIIVLIFTSIFALILGIGMDTAFSSLVTKILGQR